jgi:hypothetical protein
LKLAAVLRVVPQAKLIDRQTRYIPLGRVLVAIAELGDGRISSKPQIEKLTLVVRPEN